MGRRGDLAELKKVDHRIKQHKVIARGPTTEMAVLRVVNVLGDICVATNV